MQGRNNTLLVITTVIIAGVFVTVSSVWAETKAALVIGNSDYENVTALRNPENDVRDIARELRSLGFEVDVLMNASLSEMENGIIELQSRLKRDPEGTGFFFYAGHGVQARGVNYLIPTDADIQAGSQLRYRATSVDFVLDSMNEADNKLNMIVLDACRDNPFPWNRSSSRGLAVVGQQPPGSLIMYATAAGDVASDGAGRNGLFTEKLLTALKTPGIDVQEVFRRTGSHTFEMRYLDGERETKRVTVQKDRTTTVAFTYKPAAAAPEGFVLVEAGTFTMGSPSSERDRDDDERQHSVRISKDYYISKYEVT